MDDSARKIKLWRERPDLFVREVFQAEPDAWQEEVLKAFPTSKRIAMKASKGCGKSTILAWVIWNFLCTRPHPKIAATSISGDNLSDNLWSELAKWQNQSPFLKSIFTWTKTRIFNKQAPETHWCSARTWAQSADSSQQANTLAGLHADYLMFILDECGGIPDGVMAAAEAGLSTGKETKIVMAGNPTNLSGPLYRACTTERSLWFVREITSDPDDPKRTSRVSIEWAREQILKYGKDNPWVQVNVFGRFPPASLNSLLGPDEVSDAMNREVDEKEIEWAQKRLGIDCARFGDDKTVIFPRQGKVAFNPVEMRGARTNEIASRVAQAKEKWSSELEFVDDTGGFGAGVIDSLIQSNYSPVPINFSGKASDPRFLNKRAEIWFRMADWVKKGGKLPRNPDLHRELTTPTYTFVNGKFQLESKDQIKDRLGFSPDLADALALTFSIEEQPAADMPRIKKDEKLQFEFEPFDEMRLSSAFDS